MLKFANISAQSNLFYSVYCLKSIQQHIQTQWDTNIFTRKNVHDLDNSFSVIFFDENIRFTLSELWTVIKKTCARMRKRFLTFKTKIINTITQLKHTDCMYAITIFYNILSERTSINMVRISPMKQSTLF
jgi:hypothetical protein